MRRNKKSRILAVLLAVSMSGSSAVYAQAEEVNNPDTDIEICGEEHEMKEVQVVEPTCTEAGYVLWKCQSCGYEEKRDLKKALGHDLEVVSTEEATEDTPGKVVYKCKREKCDYTETNIISVKEPGTDGKEDNKDNDKDNNPGNNEKPDGPADPNENDKTDNNGETKPDTGNESDEDSDKTEEPAVDEEELPDVDEEYATYASSTSTEVVAEYDPTTASHTIKVAKDAKHPEEAVRFMKYYTSDAGIEEIIKSGRLPATISMQDKVDSEILKDLLATTVGDNVVGYKQMQGLSSEINSFLQNDMVGMVCTGTSVEDTLEQLEDLKQATVKGE